MPPFFHFLFVDQVWWTEAAISACAKATEWVRISGFDFRIGIAGLKNSHRFDQVSGNCFGIDTWGVSSSERWKYQDPHEKLISIDSKIKSQRKCKLATRFNSRTYNAALSACASAGKCEHAICLARDIQLSQAFVACFHRWCIAARYQSWGHASDWTAPGPGFRFFWTSELNLVEDFLEVTASKELALAIQCDSRCSTCPSMALQDFDLFPNLMTYRCLDPTKQRQCHSRQGAEPNQRERGRENMSSSRFWVQFLAKLQVMLSSPHEFDITHSLKAAEAWRHCPLRICHCFMRSKRRVGIGFGQGQWKMQWSHMFCSSVFKNVELNESLCVVWLIQWPPSGSYVWNERGKVRTSGDDLQCLGQDSPHWLLMRSRNPAWWRLSMAFQWLNCVSISLWSLSLSTLIRIRGEGMPCRWPSRCSWSDGDEG